jgi:epoxide hydrolase-like protein
LGLDTLHQCFQVWWIAIAVGFDWKRNQFARLLVDGMMSGLHNEIKSFHSEPMSLRKYLRQRLKPTRWSYQVEGTHWEAGTDLNYLKELVGYWLDAYD